MKLVLIGLFSVYGTVADGTCYAPDAPAELSPSKCIPCQQLAPNSAPFAQCVVGDQYYTCSDSVEDCCGTVDIHSSNYYAGDPDWKSHCIQLSNETPPPSPTELPLPDVSGDCVNAVSLGVPGWNTDCMTKCSEGLASGKSISQISEFANGECAIQTWDNINGNTSVESSSCFETWVYGYSQEPFYAALDGMYYYVDTPAQCMALCQQNNNCVNWIWFSDLAKTNEPELVHACALKNETQIEKAAAQSTATSDTNVTDPNWCNVGMPYQCNDGGFTCFPCDGVKRCIWDSAVHVTGWKYCYSNIDMCNPQPFYPVAPTEGPAPTKFPTPEPTPGPTGPQGPTGTNPGPASTPSTNPGPASTPSTNPGPASSSSANPGPASSPSTNPGPASSPSTNPGPASSPSTNPGPASSPSTNPGPASSPSTNPGPASSPSTNPGPASSPSTNPGPASSSSANPGPTSASTPTNPLTSPQCYCPCPCA